jgi:hypothetical protein
MITPRLLSTYEGKWHSYTMDWSLYIFVSVIFFCLSGVSLRLTFQSISNMLMGAGDSASNINYTRNLLELIYFISNSLVAFVAIVAIIYTREQITQSHHARTASIYTEFLKWWNESEMVESRILIQTLVERFKKSQGCPEFITNNILTEGDYIAHVLMHFRENDLTSLRSHVRMIEVFEYLGVLCRRGYVNPVDFYNFFGGYITNYLENYFSKYFMLVREEVSKNNSYPHPKAIFANAIWLRKEIIGFKPFELEYPATTGLVVPRGKANPRVTRAD